MTIPRPGLAPAMALLLAACVAGSGQPPYLTPVPVATNGPAACHADASWTTQEHRITHSTRLDTRPVGEAVACEMARQQLGRRSAEVCRTSYGSRTDIRNLTARTQVSGGSFACDCLQVSALFMQCTIKGDAICSFEAAQPGTGSCR